MTIMTRSGAKFWWKKDLPKHVLYLYCDDCPGAKWKEYTRAEINAEKKRKQESNIAKKRYCHKRAPCFIHVFKLNTNWFFDGWYIVIWSVYGMWYLNWKTYPEHEDFFPRIKQFLRLGLLPLVDDDVWFEEFCKTYPMKPKGIQGPRGKYLTHCVIDSYNNLIDISLVKQATPEFHLGRLCRAI